LGGGNPTGGGRRGRGGPGVAEGGGGGGRRRVVGRVPPALRRAAGAGPLHRSCGRRPPGGVTVPRLRRIASPRRICPPWRAASLEAAEQGGALDGDGLGEAPPADGGSVALSPARCSVEWLSCTGTHAPAFSNRQGGWVLGRVGGEKGKTANEKSKIYFLPGHVFVFHSAHLSRPSNRHRAARTKRCNPTTLTSPSFSSNTCGPRSSLLSRPHLALLDLHL
jgi:hypothetical protein